MCMKWMHITYFVHILHVYKGILTWHVRSHFLLIECESIVTGICELLWWWNELNLAQRCAIFMEILFIQITLHSFDSLISPSINDVWPVILPSNDPLEPFQHMVLGNHMLKFCCCWQCLWCSWCQCSIRISSQTSVCTCTVRVLERLYFSPQQMRQPPKV